MAASSSLSNKLYDLLVFGVTGFTGRFVAEEIHRIETSAKRGLKWAVAGRNESKINAILQVLGIKDIDVVVADVNDQESIEAMCAKTRVVVNVVGPYLRYGEVVVKSCIKEHSHYVDITGEQYFVEMMMARYGEEAARAGVYIVNYCGFDCVPTDLGTIEMQKNFEGELKYVECYVGSKTQVLNTGTWESLLCVMRTMKDLKKFRESTKSSPVSDLVSQQVPKRWPLFYNHSSRSWCIPFLGADEICIKRSTQYRCGVNPYLPMISNKVYLSIGSFFKVLATSLLFMIIIPLNATSWGHHLLCKFPRFFTGGQFSSKGPTQAQIAQSSFCVTIDGVGRTKDSSKDVKARLKIKGPEPAYVATSMMLVHCAMCLIEEGDKLPKEGGIYTPGAAFGDTKIIERLKETGQFKFTFEQEEENPSSEKFKTN